MELTPSQLESRRKNAQKSTGPRTASGKHRAALNALKYGRYATRQTMEQSMVLLGEDPREFHAFRDSLIAARQPADAVERMLVEDIAMLAWKKRRLDRAQEGLQLRNLEILELDRHRQALEVGRETADISQEEVLKSGLRRASKSPAKFGEILSHLETLTALVNRQDFSQDIDPVITVLYGESPTLRGAQISNTFRQLREEGTETEEARALAAGLKLALEEETRDVVEEYTLYLQEHVHVSPALRDSALAPVHPEWTAVVRHEYAIDRLIERKLRLLTQIQTNRRLEELASESLDNKTRGTKKTRFFKNEPEKLLKIKDRCAKTNRNEPKNEAEKLLKTLECIKNEPGHLVENIRSRKIALQWILAFRSRKQVRTKALCSPWSRSFNTERTESLCALCSFLLSTHSRQSPSVASVFRLLRLRRKRPNPRPLAGEGEPQGGG